MSKLYIDRRHLLKLGLSSGVLASLPFACISLTQDDSAELLQFASDSDLPVDETRTGVLSQDGFDALSTLCRYVNQAWELDADMSLYFGRLRADLQFKTEEEPSYLTEYENAVELFNLVEGRTSGVEQAWASLLFSEFDIEDFASTRLGRARRLVFGELITHQIPMSGAFKSFGLWNYRGYFGGAFTAPESYRRGAV
jgi:hypothetical protein